jgi:hypothetical protein
MPSPRIKLGLDDSDVVRGLKRTQRSFASSAIAINQAWELTNKVLGVVTRSVGALAGSVVHLAKASETQRQAEMKALAAIRLRGEFTDAAFEKLQRFNFAVQQATAIGDEQLLQLQKTLSAMGVMPEQLEKATQATIGLAEATGTNLQSAARLAARALGGETTALTRYGIEAETAAEASEELNRLFEIAKVRTQTLGGRVDRLQGNFGDLEEVMGDAITRSGALNESVDGLNALVVEMQQIFASEDGQRSVNAFFGAMAQGAALSINAITGLIRLHQELAIRARINASKLGFGDGVTVEEIGPGSTEELLLSMERLAARLRTSSNAGLESRRPGATPSRPGARRTGVRGRGGATGGGGGSGGSGGGAVETATSGGMFDVFGMLREGRDYAASQFSDAFDGLVEVASDGWDRLSSVFSVGATRTNQQLGPLMQGVQHATSTLTSGFANAITAAAAGQGDIDRLMGQMVMQVGAGLIQLGTAGLAAATLGSVIPFLAPATGGPAGIGPSAAAIATGIGIVAAGAAMGGSGGAPAGARPPAAPAGPSGGGFGGGANGARLPDGGGGGGPTVVNVVFNKVADSRRAARETADVLRAGGYAVGRATAKRSEPSGAGVAVRFSG